MIHVLYASWFSLTSSDKWWFLTVKTPETCFTFYLLVLMWYRCYSTYHLFSALFNIISVSTVKEEIWTLVSKLYLKLKIFYYLAIYCTMAQYELHRWSHRCFFSGNLQTKQCTTTTIILRSHRSIHTQVIVDNTGKIRYIECYCFGTFKWCTLVCNIPIVTQIFRPNCGKGTVDGSVES